MRPEFLTLPFLAKYMTIGAEVSSLFCRSTSNNLRIINYHSIKPGKRLGLYDVSEKNFYEQMYALKKNKDFVVKSLNLENLKSTQGIFITFDDGYSNNLNFALKVLEEFNFPFTVYVVSDFIKNKKKGFLTKNELKKLASSPLVTIASHSQSHRYLTNLSKNELKVELNESKKYLEDLTGRPIESFAYPFGNTNKVVAQAVEECGYKFAVTTYPGKVSKYSNMFLINRNVILSHDNKKTFIQKIYGHWDWLRLLIKNPTNN